MKSGNSIPRKILTLPELVRTAAGWRAKGSSVAFTNGCFDLLHAGHIASLLAAAKEGDYLVVGLNSDASVRALKGSERPLNPQDARALLLAALSMVDAVCIFEEATPLELIKALQPDAIVKGGDYTPEQVVGGLEAKAWGGRVVINPIVEGYSTTSMVEKIKRD